MSIPYIPNIPIPTNDPSVDAPNLQINTNSVLAWTQVDHFGFNANYGGQHPQVTFPIAQSTPSPTGTIGILDTQTINSISELFYVNATANIQLTSSSLVASTGSGFLPGGLQIRSGTGATFIPITFTPRFPTACISVVATANTSGGQVNVVSIGPTAFQVNSPAGSLSYYWVATGY